MTWRALHWNSWGALDRILYLCAVSLCILSSMTTSGWLNFLHVDTGLIKMQEERDKKRLIEGGARQKLTSEVNHHHFCKAHPLQFNGRKARPNLLIEECQCHILGEAFFWKYKVPYSQLIGHNWSHGLIHSQKGWKGKPEIDAESH